MTDSADKTPSDASGLDGLLAQHMPQLRAFLRIRLGPDLRQREDSADLAQSVCRELLEQRERFGEGDAETFRRWLYTAARRKLADRVAFHRAGRRDVRRERTPLTDAASADLLQAFPDGFTPSRHARAREQLEQLEAALDRLPATARELILLARVLGMSREAIAQHTGRSVGAVRTALSRAQARLAAELAEDDEG
jgi:RNA polymerase sigma-70 factor (ECF subfamily)